MDGKGGMLFGGSDIHLKAEMFGCVYDRSSRFNGQAFAIERCDAFWTELSGDFVKQGLLCQPTYGSDLEIGLTEIVNIAESKINYAVCDQALQ